MVQRSAGAVKMTRESRSGYVGMVIVGSMGRGLALRGPEGDRSEFMKDILGNASAPEVEEALTSTIHERWLRRL